MIFQRSSSVLMVSPKGGIGPDYGFGSLTGVALLLELDGAKRDQFKECIGCFADSFCPS